MSDELPDTKDKGIGGRDCVPYFDSDSSQIVFEFFYLLALLVGAASLLFWIQFNPCLMEYKNKVFSFAMLGGFFGGCIWA